MTAFDPESARAHFPALAGDEVLMDNAGGAQVPRQVLDRINAYLTTDNVQLGATYERSRRAGAAVAKARGELATLLGADDPDTLVIGDSTTGLLGRLARAMAPSLNPGDEIVVSEADHEANIGPWMRLQAQGLVIRQWKIRRGPVRLELDDLEPLLNARTRLVAVTQCSNILGSELPVADIAERVHSVGAQLCVDGVGWAAHRLPDVATMGADFYAISMYKVFGPHLALLWGRRTALERLANQNHFFFEGAASPYPLQPGGCSYELTVGAAGVVDYLRGLAAPGDDTRASLKSAFEGIAAHEDTMTRRILDFLGDRAGVNVIGDARPGPGRLPIISFTVDGVRSSRIPPYLDRRGVGIRWGDFYARRLIDALDLGRVDGVVRISLAHYNTQAEIDRLLDGLDEALTTEHR